MSSQTQQIINIIAILLFIFTLSPTSILLHIFAICMYSSIKTSSSSTTLPCSYISTTTVTMDKTNTVKVTPVVEHTPIAIPVKLTATQKKAALPFLPTEPVKSKSTEPKCLNRLFKKLAKAAPYKCTKSTEKKTQYKLTFVPIVKKNEVITPSKAETTEIVWYDNKVESATELAQRIWDEDNTVHSNLNKIVEWIGNGKESSNAILQSYMSHFDFHGLNLEQAFRILCSKLYLNGETQQIDRVLLQFSTRYFECNSQSIFGSIGK